MNKNDIGIEAIDPGRQDGIDAQSAYESIPCPDDRVQKTPKKKLNQLRPGDGRNSMPDDGAICREPLRRRNSEIGYALGVEMNFTVMVASEAFEQLCKGAFCAMAAVHEGRHNRKAHVSASRLQLVRSRHSGRIGRCRAAGRGCQQAARDRH